VGNIVYPLTEKKDVYAIVQLCPDFYYGEDDNEYETKIGLIKGILSSRNDIYPIEYLSETQFILL